MIRAGMRISNIETIHLRLPEIELRADGTQDAFIVRIDTDEGISGYGEADTSPTVAQAFVDMPASHSLLVGMRETLLAATRSTSSRSGTTSTRRPRMPARAPRRSIRSRRSTSRSTTSWAARSEVPVRTLLGGSFRESVRVYASALMPETPEAVRRHVTAQVEKGHRALKLGWGPLGFDARRDVELVAAAREAAGRTST